MKKLVLASIITLLLFSGSAGAEPCTGLQAASVDINAEFQICWNQNPEPDVSQYLLMKDGQVYDTIPASACDGESCFSPKYKENQAGVFTFTVRANDAGNHTSADSEPVILTVADLPPSKPSGCSIRIF